MNKQFEYIKGSRGYCLTVHYQEGERSDRGESHVRPEAWDPDSITQVDDEEGNDVTSWAISKFGEEALLRDKFVDLTKPRRIVPTAVLIYSTDRYIQPCRP